MHRNGYQILKIVFILTFTVTPTISLSAAKLSGKVSASGSVAETSPSGAMDGDRFSTKSNSLWQGNKNTAWWQIKFDKPTTVGSFLQINGSDSTRLRNSPANYFWQRSNDGQTWYSIPETLVHNEKRMYRIHRLSKPIQTKYLRLKVNRSHGKIPTLREIEIYPTVDAKIPFKDWLIAVNSTENPKKDTVGSQFISLAKQCKGWENVQSQWIWHGDFNQDFVSAEPRPLCAFFSGSYLEWCQRSREPWRGVQEVLRERSLPMWGACGGAQVFALLEEVGCNHPWDCPRCRDPQNPLSPIYSHIGHTGKAPCGDYSQNVGERGVFKMRKVADDPVFKGLSNIFEINESHIGQIDYVPKGWTRIVTKGPGAHTVNQCLRVKDAPIYSAQFHCETWKPTPENSKIIMSNFLKQAKAWGGYNPQAKRLSEPKPLKISK